MTWLPIETIWMTGPTSSPRYSVNDTNDPIVMRPDSISWAPTHMIDDADDAEQQRREGGHRRKARHRLRDVAEEAVDAPARRRRASRRSARYALTTRIPEKDSVSRPDTSALIFERSRKSGRSVRKA